MRNFAIAAALLVTLALPGLTAAQSRPSGGGAGASPIGHRQPTSRDVGQDGGATAPAQPSKEDRALDRALKGICRGC